jgi:hypothetical protein
MRKKIIVNMVCLFLSGSAPILLSAPLQLLEGPYKTENLGPLVYSATPERTSLFKDSHLGHTHLIAYFWSTSSQMVHLNLDTGEIRVFDTVNGRAGVYSTVLHSNGRVYFSIGKTLYEYDFQSNVLEVVATLGDTSGVQWAVEGDDGWLYLGQAVQGHVERFNPQSRILERFGIMDDPGPPYYRYAYTLGADHRYIYAGMGQNPWYLVVYDMQTGTHVNYWKDHNRSVMVSQGRTGGWYAQVGGLGFFKLENGVPTPVPAGTSLSLIDYRERGNVTSEPSLFKSKYNMDIDLDEFVPMDTVSNGQITVRWKRVEELSWRSASALVRVGPQVIKRLYADGKRLFSFIEAYGPVFYFDPASSKTTLLGRSRRSLYDAISIPGGWFLSGYPASTFLYETSRPWTLNNNTANMSAPEINPRLLDGIAKYHYYQARAQGHVFVGVHHERDATGGSLGWYDEKTGALVGRLRDPFINYDVRGLTSALNGTKIVYSSIDINASGNAKLFVIDAVSKQIEREIIPPIPGATALDKIVEVSPGLIFGIQSPWFYLADIRTGQVRYVKELGGSAFPGLPSYDRRLTLGPDGHVWLYINDDICRIEPEQGVIEKIITYRPSGPLTFHQGQLYISKGSSLRRVSGLFAWSEENPGSPVPEPDTSTPDSVLSEEPSVKTVFFPSRNEKVDLSPWFDEQVVEVTIFNRQGKEVRSLGLSHSSVQWDGRNQKGEIVSAGVYYVSTPQGRKKVLVVK